MENKSRKILTLCLICESDKILLGMKKRGFGAERWNGFGGKVEEGETIEEGIIRELMEEAEVSVEKIEKVGLLEFEFENISEIYETHVFKAADIIGDPKETEEMSPKWFNFVDIPYNKMWPDDKYWLPLLLENKKFKGKFFFDKNNSIINQELIEDLEI